MGEERPPLVFYAFDLLQLNGKNLQNLPIEERKAKLEELLKKPPDVIRYSISFTKDIPELLERAHKLGLAGLIGKRAGSRCEAGKRTGAWIKVKLHQEQEFVIGGYTNRKDRENILARCLLDSTKARSLNLLAEWELVQARFRLSD
jgi:bifunctional non-homologous end joining protein LigD